MIHGSFCDLNENSPCMDRGRCTKQYALLLVPNKLPAMMDTLYVEEGYCLGRVHNGTQEIARGT